MVTIILHALYVQLMYTDAVEGQHSPMCSKYIQLTFENTKFGGQSAELSNVSTQKKKKLVTFRQLSCCECVHTLNALNSCSIGTVVTPGTYWWSGEVALESMCLIPQTHYILGNYWASGSQSTERNCS